MAITSVTTKRAGRTVTIAGSVSGGGSITITFTSSAVPSWNNQSVITITSDFTKDITTPLSENGLVTITASGGGSGGASTSVTLPATVGVVTFDAITSSNFNTAMGARKVDVTVHTYTRDPIAGDTAVGGSPDDLQFHLPNLPANYPAYTEQFGTTAGGSTALTLTLVQGPDQFWGAGNTLQALFLDSNNVVMGSGTTTVTPLKPSLSGVGYNFLGTADDASPLEITGNVGSVYCPKDSLLINFFGRPWKPPQGPGLGSLWYATSVNADGTGAFTKSANVPRRDGPLVFGYLRSSPKFNDGRVYLYVTDCWGNRSAAMVQAVTVDLAAHPEAIELVEGYADGLGAVIWAGGALGSVVVPSLLRPPAAVRPPAATRPPAPPTMTKPPPQYTGHPQGGTNAGGGGLPPPIFAPGTGINPFGPKGPKPHPYPVEGSPPLADIGYDPAWISTLVPGGEFTWVEGGWRYTLPNRR